MNSCISLPPHASALLLQLLQELINVAIGLHVLLQIERGAHYQTFGAELVPVLQDTTLSVSLTTLTVTTFFSFQFVFWASSEAPVQEESAASGVLSWLRRLLMTGHRTNLKISRSKECT